MNEPGDNDGVGAAARFGFLRGLAVDLSGNLYVAQRGSATNAGRIRKVTPAGVVSTLPGAFYSPIGVAVDGGGNIYVADDGTIQQITPTGMVSTLAGPGPIPRGDRDGIGPLASLDPFGLDIDAAGTILFADARQVRAMSQNAAVTALPVPDPGDGLNPYDVAVDAAGSLYVADYNNARIRKVSGSPRTFSTLAGSGATGHVDGIGRAARFSAPTGVAVDGSGNVFVADQGSIRRVTSTGVVTTLVETLGDTWDVAVDANGIVYFGDHRAIQKLTLVGVGELKITWQAPISESPITSYLATATASDQETKTCNSSGETACTLRGLISGVEYDVTVTATSAAGLTSAPSTPVSATPN